jgi:hypothetical protein
MGRIRGMKTAETETNDGLRQDVAVLVPSWDGYRDVWGAFFHCFFKYWRDCPFPVFLGSNSVKYPDPRVSPILIGPDTDYSSNLTAMVAHIKQDWIVMWVEDLLLNRSVDTKRVCDLVSLAREREQGHLRLAPRPRSLVGLVAHSVEDAGTLEVVPIPKWFRYRVGLTIGLWRKDVLLKLLRPGETAWDLERSGSRRSRRLAEGFSAVPTESSAFSTVNSIRKGKWTREGVALLRREGLEACLGERPVEGRWPSFRTGAYIGVRYLLFRWYLRVTAH